MSDPVVAAVVCEGHTDYPILRAIVQELWPEVDDVLCLQPELDATEKAANAAGWSEVRRWCESHAGALHEVLEPEVGPDISLLVIAIDIDIAIEAKIVDPPLQVGAYESPRLRMKMRDWCVTEERKKVPPGVVFSTPVVAIEAWIIAALFPRSRRIEQIGDPASFLLKKSKLRASKIDGKPWKELHLYRGFAGQVASKLPGVRKACPEAERVCDEIEGVRERF